jgi:hypothetical protein
MFLYNIETYHYEASVEESSLSSSEDDESEIEVEPHDQISQAVLLVQNNQTVEQDIIPCQHPHSIFEQDIQIETKQPEVILKEEQEENMVPATAEQDIPQATTVTTEQDVKPLMLNNKNLLLTLLNPSKMIVTYPSRLCPTMKRSLKVSLLILVASICLLLIKKKNFHFLQVAQPPHQRLPLPPPTIHLISTSPRQPLLFLEERPRNSMKDARVLVRSSRVPSIQSQQRDSLFNFF